MSSVACERPALCLLLAHLSARVKPSSMPRLSHITITADVAMKDCDCTACAQRAAENSAF